MSCARTSAYAQSVELKRRRDNHQSVQRYFIFILLLTAVERAAQGWGQDERDFLPACFERISDNKFALRCCNLDLVQPMNIAMNGIAINAIVFFCNEKRSAG